MKRLRKAAKRTGCRPVLVQWIDSAAPEGWVSEECTVTPLECWTLGWLLEKTDTGLVISSCIAGPNTESWQSHAPMAIPLCSIVSWRYLDKPSAT